MTTIISPRPLSSHSKKSQELKTVSPSFKSISPTFTYTNNQKTGDGLSSQGQNTQLRPFSAQSINLGSFQFNIQGDQDEIITNSSFNQSNSRYPSAFNQMKSVLKPKKAMSAIPSQKSKRSPLLIYKESLSKYDEILQQNDIEEDFSKQYSIVQLQKQQKQNEKKKETCPFGIFSAFRKESTATLQRKDTGESFKTNISSSKFFSKPICLGSPIKALYQNQRNNSLDFTRATIHSGGTDTMRTSHGFQQHSIQQTNFILDVNGKKHIEDTPINASSKKINKHKYVVVKESTEKSNSSTSNKNQEIDQRIDKDKVIDQRISLSSVFLMNINLNKDQVHKFMKSNITQPTLVTSTENTARISYISTQIQSSPSDRKQLKQKHKQLSLTKSNENQESQIKSVLTNLQLWPSPQQNHKTTTQAKVQNGFQEFNFFKPKEEYPSSKIKTNQVEKAEKSLVQTALNSIPDYKFDSNYKTVSNHLDLKAKKIFLYEKIPKTPLIQVHFSRRQVESQFQKTLDNNKVKYCESGEYMGNFIVKPQSCKSRLGFRRKNTKQQNQEAKIDKLLEYKEIIKQDQKEKAEIRERNKQLALLNFSNFSNTETEKMLDDNVLPEDLFKGASKWIDKSPISDMLDQKFPLVKNYVDKIWSYYKEFDEIQEVDDQNEIKNNQISIKAIDEQAESIQILYEQINRMNAIFGSRVEESQKNVSQQQIDDFLKLNDERLTQQELQIVIQEFLKPQNDINYSLLDSILSKLKFFSSFNIMTRKQLLKLGKLIKKEKGSVVFNQGDFGDQMYVIVYGSCNVQVKAFSDNGLEMDRVVATLYDGQQFGELAMMKTTTKKQKQQTGETNLKEKQLKDIKLKMKRYEAITQLERNYQRKGIKKSRSQLELEYEKMKKKEEIEEEEKQQEEFNELDEQNQTKKQKVEILERTRRAATIQLIEETFLISISKNDFQLVLMNLMQAELDIKIKLLSSIHLFDMFQPFALIPMANLMKSKKYAVNDLIVEQGKPLKYFYIVSKGRLKVLRIEKTERNMKKDLKPKHMVFSIMKYKENEEEKKEKERLKGSILEIEEKPIYKDYDSSSFDSEEEDNENVERLLRDPKLANTEKIFDFQKYARPNKEKVYYKKFVEYDSFSQGDYFGGRVLTGKNPDNNQSGVAQKTVIADTNDVEVYVLERNQLQYLPQFIKEWLIIGLEHIQEYDDINRRVESQKNKNWERFKEEIYQSTTKQIKLQKWAQQAKIW